jgi:hypothetical protein
MEYQCIAFKKVDITYTTQPHPLFCAVFPLQIHDLNARDMYKDDKYCRRLTACNDFIFKDIEKP